ncbi:Hypp5534 [Branchiostoma lanceolatum]|uniref:Hypp5534 protein n=1 Tax=Branchiostoma lanceolatum TaxID=7740 RepID=A0A8J9YL90_BRALA|nr:Hypp5534 [Branchiostoma lanceolatum]
MAGLEDNSKQSDPGEDLQPTAENYEIIVTNCTKEVDEQLSQVTRERAVSRFGRLSAYTRGSTSTGTVSLHSTRSCPAAVETPGRGKLLNKRPTTSSDHISWGVTKDETTRQEPEKTMFSALSEEAKAAMLEMRKEMEECRRQLDDDTTTQTPLDNPKEEDTGVDLADDEEDEQFDQDSDNKSATPNDNAEVVDYISDYSEDSNSLQEAIFRDEDHRRPVSRLSYTHSAPKQRTVPMLPPIQTKNGTRVQRQRSYPGEIRHLNKSYPGSRPSPKENIVSDQTYVPGVGRFQVLRPAIARERSFKVTGPGYDSRFHDQVWRSEDENGDIVPREVKKMATQKCKEWLRRWVVSTPPADVRKRLSDTMD